jgi:hypothetical protein
MILWLYQLKCNSAMIIKLIIKNVTGSFLKLFKKQIIHYSLSVSTKFILINIGCFYKVYVIPIYDVIQRNWHKNLKYV